MLITRAQTQAEKNRKEEVESLKPALKLNGFSKYNIRKALRPHHTQRIGKKYIYNEHLNTLC